MNNLLEKKILLIICGGISAYKSLEVIRSLKNKGAKVKVILTKNAKEFVTPLSVTSLSQEKVYDDMFNLEVETEMDHISLSRWCDVILVAPSTANTISKLSTGSSDDLASTVILASDKDIFLAPAMNVRMWEHPSTKENINKLENFGYNIVIYPVTTQRLALKNVEDGLRDIYTNGHQNNIIDKMQTRKRLYELVEYEKYNSLDETIYNFSTEGHE